MVISTPYCFKHCGFLFQVTFLINLDKLWLEKQNKTKTKKTPDKTKDPTEDALKIKVPHTTFIKNNIPRSTIVFNTDEAKLPQ